MVFEHLPNLSNRERVYITAGAIGAAGVALTLKLVFKHKAKGDSLTIEGIDPEFAEALDAALAAEGDARQDYSDIVYLGPEDTDEHCTRAHEVNVIANDENLREKLSRLARGGTVYITNKLKKESDDKPADTDNEG